MDARSMSFDKFMWTISNSDYHGFDLTLICLVRMLKVIIMIVHSDYLWLSSTDINVWEALVVLVYDGHKVFYLAGMFQSLLTS